MNRIALAAGLSLLVLSASAAEPDKLFTASPLTEKNSFTPGIEGPGLANIDVSLIRFVPLPFRENMKIELRGDFFNVLNHTNFGSPGGTLGTPQFGRVTSARLPRTIQVGGKFWF